MERAIAAAAPRRGVIQSGGPWTFRFTETLTAVSCRSSNYRLPGPKTGPLLQNWK